MPALPSLSDLKTYLGLTGTQDDTLLTSLIADGIGMAERDTGRIFSVASNVTHRYSTDGQRALVIHDRPYSDATRVIKLQGVTLTEDMNVWVLPDRRDQTVVTMVQLEYFDTSADGWYHRYFNWFDANLDSPRFPSGSPNDLTITGTVGHPTIPGDVHAALLELIAFLYWRAKGGASSFAQVLTGTEVDLALLPQAYQRFVTDWRIRTAVAVV